MQELEQQPLWSSSTPASPPPMPPAAPPAQPRTSVWKPLGIGLLIGTLLIGAPIGGITGGVAGSFLASRAAAGRASTIAVPNPVQVQAVAVAPNSDLTAIYERAVKSVVQVNARGGRGGGIGSGFVIDHEGRILTNNHVIDGASRITVRFNDGTEIEARVLGRDPAGDLALLQARVPAEVPPLPLADSDLVKPGEVAVAIGSPQGLGYSITAGIVSGIDRTAGSGSGRPLSGLIQTDAAINPGNSGGPLLNGRGEVIGITTLGSTGVQNIGFAVPINAAKRILPRLIAGEVIQHAWLGITAATAQPNSSGVEIAEVIAGSPAARAGLSRGDIITSVAGKPVRDVNELRRVLEEQRVGQTVTVEFTRGGRPQSAQVTLQAWPTTS
ncbi:MAG: trypsin-like peptidase domain-containing protein [Chloroflexota bacterium]|nr:trypsin-like peptidase domain-containing protein [Dehalococcoidia bacterium]MDW8253951.1 trypsin-like peptidase domain-containing protein [Chloroflexota bacterium]